MDDFIKKVLKRQGIDPPVQCLASFGINFDQVSNAEWFDVEDFFEVIFYKDQLEHIALFNKEGLLQEYKINLPKEHLPETIKSQSEEKGEIMNSVLRNKGNSLEYELIIRDRALHRHLYVFSELGRELNRSRI